MIRDSIPHYLYYTQDMAIRYIGYNGIKGVSEAEHQSNTNKGRIPYSAEIQYKERSVIDAVRNYRLKQHIVRLAPAVESRIKYVLEGIHNIENEQYHYKLEQFIHVAVSENMLHKRLIQRNCYHP